MKFFSRLSRGLGILSAVLGCCLFMINICDILMGVAARYFFHAAPVWTEELARFTMIWMMMIGAASAFLHGDQMSVDFVVMNCGRRGKALCRFFSAAVQFAVLGILVWFGTKNVIGSWKMKTMALGIPKSIPLMSVPVGMGLYMAALLAKCLSPEQSGNGEKKE
jgi:TRAP-type C4-dicarboxylate transport system permease small subunit